MGKIHLERRDNEKQMQLALKSVLRSKDLLFYDVFGNDFQI